MLEVDGLVKDYGSYRAVDNVSFTIRKGEVLGLLGPNGAGKSTTIQMLAGVTTPTQGTIRYFGHDFKRHRQACLQRLNYASAYNTLQEHITVKENLTVFSALYGVKNGKAKVAELLDYFGISRLGKNKYKELSAGERTRVNLVKSLLNDPELILMDEPTASLDPDIADKTLGLIEQLRDDRQLSILFTSHNMNEVTRICNDVIFLDRGKIVSHDTPANHMKRLGWSQVSFQFKGQPAKVEQIAQKYNPTHVVFDGNKHVNITLAGKDIPTLLAAVHDTDIEVVDIDITKPTLEDVFLDIARKEKP